MPVPDLAGDVQMLRMMLDRLPILAHQKIGVAQIAKGIALAPTGPDLRSDGQLQIKSIFYLLLF